MLAASSVAYATERLSDALWDELMPLLAAHWQEIGHYDDLPLDPDREQYAALDASGGIRIFTARTGDAADEPGRLIGYLAVFVSKSLHSKGALLAAQDVLFVDPLHRGSRTGVGLIAYAHSNLRTEGVQVIYQRAKHCAELNIGPVLERLLGYTQLENVWFKRLCQPTCTTSIAGDF